MDVMNVMNAIECARAAGANDDVGQPRMENNAVGLIPYGIHDATGEAYLMQAPRATQHFPVECPVANDW
jgi:hypothetical protein